MLKMEILLLASIFSFVLISSLSFALSCSSCLVNNCVCSITECSSGILRIYSSCSSRIPRYEYSFYNSQFTWSNAPAGTFYFKALCSDGSLSDCKEIQVKSSGTTTTIQATTTTSGTCQSDSNCLGGKKCVNGTCKEVASTDYTWLFVALIIVIAVILFLVFFVFKRKPRATFEEIYKKWTR
jgi:hypothetical protein